VSGALNSVLRLKELVVIHKGDAGERCQNLPVIAMTENAMKGDKEKRLAAGMDDYLCRPIESDDLLEKLIEYLIN